MKKFFKIHFGKQLLAGLLIVFCMAATLSGCKIEYPDDLAASSPSVSESSSISHDYSSSSESSNISSESSETSSNPKNSESSSSSSQNSSKEENDKNSSSSKAPSSSQNSSKEENDKNSTSSKAPSSSQNSSKEESDKNSTSSKVPSSSSQSSSTTPKPVEPEDTEPDENKPLTCTMSITCKTILDNMDLFNKDKLSVLPKDGVIYAERTVTFYEGESVFDVLLRETKKNRIHMEHENFPIYNSEYIEGINNIYEFDCGEGSGWMYKVNGWFPNYGCSRYQVKPGDKIEWIYTCDLGHDIGGELNRR